jgi:hypothetical protein
MIGSGIMHNGVYVYKGMIQGSAFTTSKKDDTTLWLYIMGHPLAQSLQRFQVLSIIVLISIS